MILGILTSVITAEVLYRIAKALDSTMEWMLTGEGVAVPKEIVQ